MWPASIRNTRSGGTSTATGSCEARRASRCPPTTPGLGFTSYTNLLGIGRYFKGNEDAWFHNAQLYLLAEEDSTIAGSARRESFFSLLPGFLTQVGKELWFAYYGIEVPMIGPKAYTYQMIFTIVHAY